MPREFVGIDYICVILTLRDTERYKFIWHKIRWSLTLPGSEGKSIIPHLGKVCNCPYILALVILSKSLPPPPLWLLLICISPFVAMMWLSLHPATQIWHSCSCSLLFSPRIFILFFSFSSGIQFPRSPYDTGENIGEWGGENFSLGKLCSPTSKGKPGNIVHWVWGESLLDILKGFEGTAFAQHMWSPAADVRHKLSHPRPSKPSSLR